MKYALSIFLFIVTIAANSQDIKTFRGATGATGATGVTGATGPTGAGGVTGTPNQVPYYDNQGNIVSDQYFTREVGDNRNTFITAVDSVNTANLSELGVTPNSSYLTSSNGAALMFVSSNSVTVNGTGILINSDYYLPNADGTSGQVITTDGAGNLSFTNGSFWSLTGNSGTTAGTNFIGTTDSKKLYFKTKNTTAMVVDTNQNVGIGTNTPFGKFTVNDNDNNLIFGAQYSDLVTDTVWGTTMIDSCHKYGIIIQDPSSPNDHYTVLYSMDSCTGEGAQLFLNYDAYNQEMGIILNYDNPDTNKASRLTFNSDGLRILKNTDFSYLFQITPTGQMVYPKGAASGSVLTSNASGNATWQNPHKFRIVSADLEEADSTLNGGTVGINNGASNWTFYLPSAGSLPAGFEITVNRLNSTSVGTVDVALSGAGVLMDLNGTYSGTFSLAAWGSVGRSMTWVSDGNLIWYLKSCSR